MLGSDCCAGPLAEVESRPAEGGQWTSELWAENSFGPKKERRKENPFYFQKTFL
jgi:hypothetical protein